MKKIFKYILLFLAIVSLSFRGRAGDGAVDSLLSFLKTDKEDTNKVNHLNTLGWELKNSNPDTSIILSNQALVLLNSLPLEGGDKGVVQKLLANTLGQLGVFYRLKGDYPQALDYYFKALKMKEELGDKKGIAAILSNIGLVYWNQGDYPKALDYYFRALKMDEELGNKNGIARGLGNIGIIYSRQGDYAKALDYYFKALKMAEELGYKQLQASILGNIGIVYKEQSETAKVHPVERDSLLNRALDYYFRALKMAEEFGYKQLQANSLGNIGALYTSQDNYAEAEKYLADALKLDKEIGAQDGERDDENSLSELYEKTGRFNLALEHYKKAMVLKDTLFSEEKNKEITRKEMNYEFEKKEAATKAEQNKKDAVTQIIIYSVSAGFALVLLLAVFIFRGYRQKQKANVIIAEQKKIVEEKQKDIIDSITYAKRIQRALLPTEKYIDRTIIRLKKR